MNKQLALAIQINDEASLSNFNWDNNFFLKQQISNMLLFKKEKILYIWGAPGSGKSHLLQGCCQAMSQSLSAIYLPLKLLKDWGAQSLEDLEGQKLICIDDIEAIAGDKEWEEALFHLYNKIKDGDENLLILSGENPPPKVALQLADLRSRLSWGLVLQLHELNDEEKIKTLQDIAERRGFDLPANVSQFLIKRCSRNMHDLHTLLNQLDNASLQAQRKITIPFVKEIL